MKILIYANPIDRSVARHLDEIRDLVPYLTTVVSSRDAFKEAFSRCLSGETIILFFVNNEKDQTFLEDVEIHFLDTKLFIHLKEKNSRLVRWAHTFKPRMVVSGDDDPRLLPVMIQKSVLNMIHSLANHIN